MSHAVQEIRIAIVDDQPIFRKGLRWLLDNEPDLRVVAELTTEENVIQMLEEQEPDVLLLDLGTPQAKGLLTLQGIQQESIMTKVIVLTHPEHQPETVAAVKCGASGIVLKKMKTNVLLNAIRAVHEGRVWLDAATTTAVMSELSSPFVKNPQLSGRETQIVNLVVQGCSNKEIAEKLSIARQTVNNHTHKIFRKLNIPDRVNLVLYALGPQWSTNGNASASVGA